MTARIGLREGSVYLPAPVVETYFRGVGAVVVLIRDGRLMILPVHQATSGGCLLKQRNAAGDRVAQARDVFLEHGLAGLEAPDLPALWDAEAQALCADLPAGAKQICTSESR